MITALLKNAVRYGLTLIVTCLLCACPYSSVYKLDDSPTYNVDEQLLGKWAVLVDINGHQGPVKMILSKKDEQVYNICFTGYLDALRPFNVITEDTIKGTAFMSPAVSRQFMNISVKGQVYIAECLLTDNKLSLLPLNEHFTPRIVKSNEVLRTALEVHYKTRLKPFYDEAFCLKDMVKVN